MEITRNYRQQFREAQVTNNYAKMAELFDALCDEAQIPYPERDQSQALAGKEFAERMNERDKKTGAKKI